MKPRLELQLSLEIKTKPKDWMTLQNGQCPACGCKIDRGMLQQSAFKAHYLKGILTSNARYCDYTGRYFCKACHLNETSLIPARVLLNWDFREYRVCSAAKEFLDRIETEPWYRVNEFDVSIVRIARGLCQVKILRTQLNFLKDYFQTCRYSDR